MPDFAVIGSSSNRTTVRLVEEWNRLGHVARLMSGREARGQLDAREIAVGRIDVLPTVDGVEPGLLDLLMLERRGVTVLNPTFGLLAAHDKLLTSRCLGASGLPHPRTGVVRSSVERLPVSPPLVVKPRFGSWGVDVFRCMSEADARACLISVADRPWFRRHGALVQELVEHGDRDLRLLVAGRQVVGAVMRIAAPGEWRTNVSLGGERTAAVPSAEARRLAIAATAALRCDLVAVDLVPIADGRYTVLEINAAADFDEPYGFPGRNVFEDTATALV